MSLRFISGSGGGGGSVNWTSVAFSSSIPLDAPEGKYTSSEVTISGALTLTPSGPVAGGFYYAVLIADGTHIPTMGGGFRELGTSSGFNNTAGIENVLRCQYDGTFAWFDWQQQVNATPVSNPIPVSAVTTSATTIDVTFSTSLDTGSVPATSAFALTASGGAASVTNVAVSSNKVTLTFGRSLGGSETLSLAYTQPGSNKLRDAATGTHNAASYSGESVTNNLAAPTVLSAQVANAAPTIIAATFSVALDAGSVPATTAFSVSASGGAATVSSVAISGATLNLTLGRSITAGETITFSYTQPGSNKLRNAPGIANVANFSSQSVTDNVVNTTTLFDLTSGGSNSLQLSAVMRIAQAHMSAVPGHSTSSIQVTIDGSVTTLYVGQAAASGNNYDAQSLTKITFNGGSNGVSASQGTRTTSDVITFNWDGTTDLIFSYFSNAVTVGMQGSPPASLNSAYYSLGSTDYSGTAVKPGGWSATSGEFCVMTAIVW